MSEPRDPWWLPWWLHPLTLIMFAMTLVVISLPLGWYLHFLWDVFLQGWHAEHLR